MAIKWNWVVEGITTLAVIGAGIYAFGQFNGRLTALESRIDKLEGRVDPLRTLKVGRGDLCVEILKQQGSTKDVTRLEQLEHKWTSGGCEEMPAAAMTKDIPPPPKPQSEQ